MSSTVTVRPANTVQQGSWTVVGASDAATALGDGADTSYIQLTPRCRLETQKMKLGMPAITLPTGARISSVGVRIRIQTVVWPAPQPICLGWFFCHRPPDFITAIIDLILLLLFGWRCPRQPTVTWQDQQLQQLTSDPNGNPWTLASFNQFQVHLGRDDAASNPLRISEVYVDVVYTQQSTLSVTGPTGTVTNTCRPTVTWAYSSPDSNPQQAYQVAVYTQAQTTAAGFTPFVTQPVQGTGGGVFGEDLQWTLSGDITNGTYVAYVQVDQVWPGTTDFPSVIAFGSWTQSIAGAPIAQLTATFDLTYNRVRLDISPGAASPATVFYAVQCSRDSGTTWGPVRTGLQLGATGSTQTIYDYEAPLNVPSQYRVLAYGQTGSLYFPASDYSPVRTVTPLINEWWLKDVLDPTSNTPLPVKYQGDTVTYRRVQGTFEVIAAGNTADKIVVNGPMYGPEGTLILDFTYQQPTDYWAAFRRLDLSGHILLLQSPTGDELWVLFGPGAAGSDMSAIYEMVPDYREVTVSYTSTAPLPITA